MTERNELAELNALLTELEAAPQRAADPRSIIETRNWQYEAAGILASDWFKSHDQAVRRAALLEAADELDELAAKSDPDAPFTVSVGAILRLRARAEVGEQQ